MEEKEMEEIKRIEKEIKEICLGLDSIGVSVTRITADLRDLKVSLDMINRHDGI